MQYWELNKWRMYFIERAIKKDEYAKDMLILWDKDKQAYIKELRAFLTRSNNGVRSLVV
jgi:hypothetical protein